MFRFFNLLALAFAAVAGPAAAQHTARLEGRITTDEGAPAEAVTVLVKGTEQVAVTGGDGRFVLEGVAPGRLVLAASRIGLVGQEREATAAAGRTTRVDFTLAVRQYELDGVAVSAERSLNEQPAAIGKIGITPMDLPQSMAVLGERVLAEQQVLHLSDALKNLNGLYVMGTTGGTQEELAGRGFSLGSSSTFKNGVRFNNSVMPEMSAIERVEVLKGSAAILFGNVSAGGVINLVTKKPRFEQGGALALRAGSYGFYKPALDVYGPLGGGLAYRLNTTYQNAGSFRERVGAERTYVNPSLLARLGRRTEVLVEGDYLKDDRTTDYGTGAVDYTIARVPRSRFLGAAWSYFRAEQAGATAAVTHQIGRGWQARAVGGMQRYDHDNFSTMRPNAGGQFVRADGMWIRGVQRSRVNEAYGLGQFDLTGRLRTGFAEHQLLVGADADRYHTETTGYKSLARYDTINIFIPGAYTERTDIPELDRSTLTTAPVARTGLYVQDLIAITERLKLLAGVRWTRQTTRSEVLTYAGGASAGQRKADAAVTPRLGVVYQPGRAAAVFASYANSFTLNTGVDVDGRPLPPSFIDQYETGLKTDWFSGRLSANLTLYRIVNSNLAQMSLAGGNTNANIRELAGEVTSKGVEVDVASRRWRGLSVMAGYSYNETRYTESNVYVVGSLLRYNPNHTANASLFYAAPASGPLGGLELGAGAVYIGERMAGRSTRLTVRNDAFRLMPIDGFTQIDASAGYAFDRFSVQLRVANFFDVLSYYAHDDNSINPIAPRTVSLTTRVRL